MPDEAWRVDGYNLSNLAHDIQTYEGLDDVPDLIYDDLARMQDHGVDPSVPYFGPGRKMVGMYVSTTLPNGSQPTSQTQARANFDTNLDTLLRVFYRRKLLDVQRTMSDGSVRRAYCRTVSGIKPSLIGISSGLVVFDLQLPYSFWEDLNNTTQTVGIGANQILTNFASATAPMTELEFDLNGPSSNPVIRDPETSSWVRYSGTQASGNTITLKNADQSVTGAALSTITHDGDPKWLSLYPIAGGPLVTLESGTAGATVTVRGKKKYLR